MSALKYFNSEPLRHWPVTVVNDSPATTTFHYRINRILSSRLKFSSCSLFDAPSRAVVWTIVQYVVWFCYQKLTRVCVDTISSAITHTIPMMSCLKIGAFVKLLFFLKVWKAVGMVQSFLRWCKSLDIHVITKLFEFRRNFQFLENRQAIKRESSLTSVRLLSPPFLIFTLCVCRLAR